MTARPDSIAPARSLAQRMAALDEANRIRFARSELKRRIKQDRTYRLLKAALELRTEALGLRPHDLDTMRVFDLLIAAPKLGRVKVNRALNLTRISPSKTLAGMTARQREELLAALDGRMPRVWESEAA